MNINSANTQSFATSGVRALPSLAKGKVELDTPSVAQEPQDTLSSGNSYVRRERIGRAVAIGTGAALGIAAGVATALTSTGTAIATGAGVLGLIGVGLGVFGAGLSGMGAPGTQVSAPLSAAVWGGIGAGVGAVAGAIGGPVGGIAVGLVTGAAGFVGSGLLWSKATGEF